MPALTVAFAYGYLVLLFAPTVIVLERLPVVQAMRRSIFLVRNSFWRVLGILVLAGLIVLLIIVAVTFPFTLITLATHGGMHWPTARSSACPPRSVR